MKTIEIASICIIFLSLNFACTKDRTIADPFVEIPNKITYFQGYSINNKDWNKPIFNPSRGFRLEIGLNVETTRNVFYGTYGISSSLMAESLKFKSDSISVIQTYFYLTAFENIPLSQNSINNIQLYFKTIRNLGKKTIIRFAYETDADKKYGCSEEYILKHIEQLKPIIELNKDVILCIQAGFIGAWGEWHSSKYALEESNDSKRNIIEKLLWMAPEEIMIQVRHPTYRNYAQKKSLNRIGVHNDFIVHKEYPWDGGINYNSPDYEFIKQTSKSTIIDGELPWGSWSINKDIMPVPGFMIDGKEILNMLKDHHYNTLSIIHNNIEPRTGFYSKSPSDKFSMDFWKETNITEKELTDMDLPIAKDYFKDDAGKTVNRTVYEYIRDHLGYRFEIESMQFTDSISIDDEFLIRMKLQNKGFSKLYGAYSLSFVLINSTTEELTIFDTDFAPIDWMSVSDHPTPYIINHQFQIPNNITPGQYKIGLWIHENDNNLKMNPNYSIRLANANIEWYKDINNQYGINIIEKVIIK